MLQIFVSHLGNKYLLPRSMPIFEPNNSGHSSGNDLNGDDVGNIDELVRG